MVVMTEDGVTWRCGVRSREEFIYTLFHFWGLIRTFKMLCSFYHLQMRWRSTVTIGWAFQVSRLNIYLFRIIVRTSSSH